MPVELKIIWYPTSERVVVKCQCGATIGRLDPMDTVQTMQRLVWLHNQQATCPIKPSQDVKLEK